MHSLILGKVWPEPSSTAAGRRVCELIEALQYAGYQVSFASAAQAGGHSQNLAVSHVDAHSIAVNDSSFDPWIQQLAPDLVIFDRFMIEEQFGWRVEQACPQAARILDTSDLHCLREARQAQLKSGSDLKLKNDIALREIASILRCDGTLIISEAEMALLHSEFGVDQDLLCYWPFLMDAQGLSSVPEFVERDHFMMIGSFLHAPNLDAARWCRDAIWPLIRKQLPEAELHIYGSYGDKYASELEAPATGIFFKGRVGDALATMAQYRVNLAPLRFGAGLKGKLFDGFSTGTSSVTTPVGAEGIVGKLDWGCEVSVDPEVFAQTAVEVYRDEASWVKVRDCGAEIVKTRFSRADWMPRLGAWLEVVRLDLDARRERNFTGQLLRHHQHRSTEYMSRWIEAKNRST